MPLLLSAWPENSESRQRMLQSLSSANFPATYSCQRVTKLQLGLNLLQRCRTTLVLLIPPIAFLPLLISNRKEWRCAFCVCVMAVYWMTEVLPLAVTAMLPVILFPLTGVMTSHDVAQQFINDTNFLFIGGLIMAAAVEKCNLHERVALSVLKIVGGEPKWIMLGFMTVTALLSMFISNTATTAMMVPIGQSVIDQLIISYNSHPQNRNGNPEACKRMSTALVLCVCIAANIGGTGMLTGTPSNLVMVGQLSELFGDVETSINYMTWFLFSFPLMCLCLAGTWCVLTIFFLRSAPGKDPHITELMHKRYDDLPRISYAEKSVICCFTVLLFLWMFRKPGFFRGFGELLPKESYTDSTSAMIVAVLLFILPSEKPNLLEYKTKEEVKQSHLMDWSTMQKNFPWNIVILLGGGFALAAGVKDSGLSMMVGRTLASFNHLPLWVMQLLTMLIVMATTNICSNTVTATIFLPIVATMATEMERHPFTMMLPTTLACSFAFVLPVGTPPNAIVFGSGMVKVSDMASVGVVISLVCLTFTVLYMNTVAHIFLPLSEFPAWAHPLNSSVMI
ncbi:Sodium-dependent high-affinity dicarboxylate transporter 3 [Parelaphostrongylus tenuis]|uniref:Sodium-dependent high-affinity dicarboxylate transporter 3 n=1 Tax=Parelaphostrongylus tenuis TaxID=148309 RepID=A0AAD5N6L6_PARTN|nr:Sodium-dependent high-affinity dicarboxylate transporter 3 [Parelaphostrongylus tenuis]